MNLNLVDKLKKVLRKRNKNPLFVGLRGKKLNFRDRIIRDMAREIARFMEEYAIRLSPKGGGKVSSWKSRDLEISRNREWEKERKKNELPHPIEK